MQGREQGELQRERTETAFLKRWHVSRDLDDDLRGQAGPCMGKTGTEEQRRKKQEVYAGHAKFEGLRERLCGGTGETAGSVHSGEGLRTGERNGGLTCTVKARGHR